ncbi:M61 family metallopeptidase [Ferrimonas sp. SCSIO 43195]|uniref:M61 family metallopeptidase n=1 Tax=Ferrimonas sp. SCSIO 43195 TaxID=2822844 RepID=UPI00207617CC|nr:PDZ domain-containing protein [Ferrimonas sp. SCSIO 43195]USD35861.1 M61 family metallopeptidase [Ferrimonas sp. SCSIO 43195]
MIQYRICPIDPLAHLFEVELLIGQSHKGQRLSLPSWIPGSYMVRDFCRNLIAVSAYDDHQSIELKQLNKQRWEVQQDCHKLILRYQVYAWDMSVRSAHLDQTHGFFNGTSVFLKVEGREAEPVKMQLLPPPGDHYRHWRVATAMTPAPDNQRYAFGAYVADNYDELIDHPVEMGEFTLASFDACGVQHDLVLTGRHWADTDRICADLKKICEAEITLFGGTAPYDYYLFMTMVVGAGFGGLEHRSSTALVCGRSDLPAITETGMTEGYRTFLSLCSHEYFHNWNVKRIKPARFVPYDLEQESYTTQLWAYEGITSYYDDWLTYRAGCVDRNDYLVMLGELMTRVTRGQGRFKQTLQQSSFNAWTKFYKQDENAQNAIVSYYTKGALFALYLDLSIRLETDHRHCLDHLMQRLWQDYGSQGIGTEDDTHQNLVSELIGRDASDLFAWLSNTDDLPLAPLLAQFGVQLSQRAASGNDDKGGSDNPALTAELGAKYTSAPLGVKLVNVVQDGPAHRAGLAAGDVLIAVNDLQVDTKLDKTLNRYGVGAQLRCHWFRRDELMTGTLILTEAQATSCVLTVVDDSLLHGWL